MIIYDVACQWHKNFFARIEKSPALSWPGEMEIMPAIGKFHLSAHKPHCFSRFSLMFLKGAGHVDGEILETLWASFNKISPSARSMTLAHCQELYDDYMRDSNWKKLVGLGKSTSMVIMVFELTLNGSEIFIEKIQGSIGRCTKNSGAI